MTVDSISNLNAVSGTTYKSGKTDSSRTSQKKEEDVAVIYEKGEQKKEKSPTYSSTIAKNASIDRDAVVAQLKADNDARIKQLQDLVSNMMQQQGVAIKKADDIWSFLAEGNFTVSEAAKAKAQEEISEDGYWGVNQTSDRIVSFAIALSGNDPSKADTLINAFKKGFSEATKTWGKELPDISKKTYDAVMDKFDKWVNGTYPPAEEADTDSKS